MSDVGRFERGEPYSTSGGVNTFHGIEPLTGLRVLIYEFAGPPRTAPGRIDSPHIPAVLASSFDNGRGTLVAAYPTGATLIAPGESVVDDQFVLQSVQALRDAERLGLVHGDINPSRLLYAGGRVYLEGYGVPWGKVGGGKSTAQQAALLADLKALVNALIALGGDQLSAEMAASLTGAASDASNPPPTAERLYSLMRRLSGGAVTAPPTGFADLTLPIEPLAEVSTPAPGLPDAAFSSVKVPTVTPASNGHAGHPGANSREVVSTGPVSQARPTASETRSASGKGMRTSGDRHLPPDREPITLTSDPGLTTPAGPSPREGQRFVKDLPPGATYRAGSLENSLRPAPFRLDKTEDRKVRSRAWRGPVLLLLLVLVAGLAAYLAVLAQRNARSGLAGAGSVSHLVEVRIEPANLPPVSLVVERSPSGSTFAAGTVMGSVPRRVLFDANGTWVLYATFQGRQSARVNLQVPQDTTITLTFPPLSDSP